MLCVSCTNQAADSVVIPTASSIALPQELQKDELQESVDTETLNKSLALAIKKQDYRLLATSTRGLSIPGVNPNNYQTMVQLCGKKYIAVGDVITSEYQRKEHKKVINYMRQYNERILIFCQEKIREE
jgi:hypothetical protein